MRKFGSTPVKATASRANPSRKGELHLAFFASAAAARRSPWKVLAASPGSAPVAGHREEVRRIGQNIRPQRSHLAGGHPALRIIGRQEAAEASGQDKHRRGLHAVGGRMMRRILEEALIEIG